MSRLAVIAPNWLGDAVMALPALADIRRASPAASLAVIARPAIAPVFSLVPGIDEIVVLASKRGREMVPDGSDDARSRSRFDTVVVLPNSFHAALTAWRAGIPERWGYRTDWRRPLLTRAIDPPGPVHQVEYYQRLVAALGFANGQACPGEPRVVVSDELREAAIAELRGAGWDGHRPLSRSHLAPRMAAPSAGRPPLSRARPALGDDGMQAVMVGSRADLPVAREIEAALGVRGSGDVVLNLMGTDLPMLAAHSRAARW